MGTLVPITVVMPDGSARNCNSLPCQFSIDVGKKKGQFLDSGWIEVEIQEVPTGIPLTLTYSTGGAKNESFATWTYWDKVNTPPVAKFIFAPDDPLEGDVVQFVDGSFDPGDSIVSWEWNIDGETFTSQNPFFIFPDEGSFIASLTVTDTDGVSTTVSTGGTATDGTPVPPLVVGNADPLVNALDVEALAGEEVSVIGRFLDPGWEDVHSAAWSLETLGGDPVPVEGFDDDADGSIDEDPVDGVDNDSDGLIDEDPTLFEENDPLLSSGLVPGFVTPSSDLTGTLTVDDEGTGGTERILGIFAEQLLQGSVTVGDAHVNSIYTYLNGLGIMTVYDEKSSIALTLWGLPMYRIDPAVTPAVASITIEPLAVEESGPTFELTTVDAAATEPTRTVTTSHSLELVETVDGDYYTIEGNFQATPGRPIEPIVVSELDDRHAYATGPPPVHGVLVKGGAFTDILGWDPRIARPTFEFEIDVSEPQECLPGLWPSELVTVNSIGVETLVAFAGQFQCTDPGPPVTGVQRLGESLTLELLRCPASSDTDSPVVNSIDLRSIDATTVEVTVDASDPGGIARIVVLRIGVGVMVSTELSLGDPLPTDGSFILTVADVGPDDAFTIQVADGNCNTVSATGKGTGGVSLVSVDAGPDQAYTPGVPVSFVTTVFGCSDLTEPVSFVWHFGDGASETGILAPSELATVDVTVDASGNCAFGVEHTYSSSAPPAPTATVKVTDAAGGVGADDVLLSSCNFLQQPDC